MVFLILINPSCNLINFFLEGCDVALDNGSAGKTASHFLQIGCQIFKKLVVFCLVCFGEQIVVIIQTFCTILAAL